MLDYVFILKKCSMKVRVTIKSLISTGLIILAICLPQIVHTVFGQVGGVQWMPMYLPVLIGGCILGTWWGLGIGIASPLISFLITSVWNNPMPAASRLPFMIVELAIFAFITGLFSKSISKNGWLAFPAVLLAQVAGRTVFMLSVLMFQNVTPFTPSMIWAQIQTGLIGLILQAIIVPFLVLGLRFILQKEKDE